MTGIGHAEHCLNEALPAGDAPAVLQDVPGPLIGVDGPHGGGLSDGVHAVGEAPALAAEHRGPAAVVDGVEVGAHGHGPGLQVGVSRQGLVLRDSGGTALRHPLDALAEQLRHVPGGDHGAAVFDVGGDVHGKGLSIDRAGLAADGHDDLHSRPDDTGGLEGLVIGHVGAQLLRQAPDGDHGPAVDHPGQILRIHPVAVQRHVGPGLGDFRLRPLLGGTGVDGGPFRLRHHL